MYTRKNCNCIVAAVVLLLFITGCSRPADEADPTAGAANSAVDMRHSDEDTGLRGDVRAELSPTEGNTARGTITFTSTDDGVVVRANLSDVTTGSHGLHIHETGDCSAPDGTSAGGHFAPGGTPHGSPEATGGARHAGDLGNIIADADGNASYERVDLVVDLKGNNSIIGKAVIVHAGEDDLISQPTGAAGPRIACGVIE